MSFGFQEEVKDKKREGRGHKSEGQKSTITPELDVRDNHPNTEQIRAESQKVVIELTVMKADSPHLI